MWLPISIAAIIARKGSPSKAQGDEQGEEPWVTDPQSPSARKGDRKHPAIAIRKPFAPFRPKAKPSIAQGRDLRSTEDPRSRLFTAQALKARSH